MSKVLLSVMSVMMTSLFFPGYSQVNRPDSNLLEIKKKESSDFEAEKRSTKSLIDNAIDNPFTDTAKARAKNFKRVSCSTAIFADEVLNPYLKKANVDNSKRTELINESYKITNLAHFNVNASSQCEGYSIAISNAMDHPPGSDKDDNSREIVFDLILKDTKVWGDGPWLKTMWKRHVTEKSRTKNAHDIQLFSDVLRDAFDKFTSNGQLREHFQFDKLEDCEKNKSKILSIPAIKSSIADAKKFLSDVKPYCMKRRDAEVAQPKRELSPFINDFGRSDGRIFDKRAIPLPKEYFDKPTGTIGK